MSPLAILRGIPDVQQLLNSQLSTSSSQLNLGQRPFTAGADAGVFGAVADFRVVHPAALTFIPLGRHHPKDRPSTVVLINSRFQAIGGDQIRADTINIDLRSSL